MKRLGKIVLPNNLTCLSVIGLCVCRTHILPMKMMDQCPLADLDSFQWEKTCIDEDEENPHTMFIYWFRLKSY